MVRMFANGPEDRDSIPGRVIPKTQKMELDASMFNTQHHKVQIKGKVDQFRERGSKHSSLHLGVVAIEKGAFGSPSTTVSNNNDLSGCHNKVKEPSLPNYLPVAVG